MNKLSCQLLLGVYLLFGSFHVFSQSTTDLNFSCKEAIEFGMQQNKKLKIQNVKTDIAGFSIKETRNEQLPSLKYHTGFHVLTNLNQYENGFLHAPTTYHTPRFKYDFTLDAEIPIYEGGIIKNEIIKKEAEERVAKWRLRKDQKDFRLQIISAYLHVLHIEEQQALLISKLKEDSLIIAQTESLKRNGVVTQNEVLRTQLQLSNHKMALTEWNNEKAIVEHEIKTILGITEHVLFSANTSDLLVEKDKDVPQVQFDEVFEQNEGLQIAKEELFISKQNKKLIKANALPKISAGAEYGLNYPNFMFFPPQEHLYSIGMVGFNFVMPLDQLLKNKTKVATANKQIEIAHLEIEEKEEAIYHEVFKAEKMLEEANDKITIANQAILQAEENYRIVKKKYLNHLSLITELIDADNALLEAQSQKIALDINKQIKYYQLQYILGNI